MRRGRFVSCEAFAVIFYALWSKTAIAFCGGYGHRYVMSNPTRRDVLRASAAVAASTVVSSVLVNDSRASASADPSKLIGIQIGAVSFADEGVDQVLDTVQQKGGVNALFLAAYTYGRGIAGRQVPGQPLPDHGKQEYDQKTFHGGNYATPHAQFYEKTTIKVEHAPDVGDFDLLGEVIPKAKSRKIKTYAWYEDNFQQKIAGIADVKEVDLAGRRSSNLCPLHPDYRSFLIGLTQDFCTSYDIDGIMWGSERQGPLHNMFTHASDPMHVTCFCEHHQKAARERGIDVDRAKEGYTKLAEFISGANKGVRPTDGYFVSFWRLLLEYPELLAWEKLWTDSKHSIYSDVFKTAKSVRDSIQVGFHIWHNNSFSPFFRAEQDYAKFATVADYLKIVLYNNCGGPRYARAVDQFASTIFRDVPPDELQRFFDHVLNYSGELSHEQLPVAGLSSDYVASETKRALADVGGKCKIYPGIDIDIPTDANEKKTTPDDVYAATTAALKAGADGLIFSRKYSEMKLTNLAAGGRAVKEFGA